MSKKINRKHEDFDNFINENSLFMNPKSIFRIVFDSMVKYGKDPLGLDIDEWLENSKKIRDKILKNKNINKLKKDINNYHE